MLTFFSCCLITGVFNYAWYHPYVPLPLGIRKCRIEVETRQQVLFSSFLCLLLPTNRPVGSRAVAFSRRLGRDDNAVEPARASRTGE